MAGELSSARVDDLAAASRVRIGIIKPTRRDRPNDYWRTHLPPDLDLEVRYLDFQRGDLSTFDAAFPAAARLAGELRAAGCRVVVVAGTPPFLLRGAAFERAWATDLAHRIGADIVTPMSAHVVALQATSVRVPLVASYYGPALAARIGTYLRECGIGAVVAPGYSLSDRAEGLYTTSLADLNRVGSDEVVAYCTSIAAEHAGEFDALYINGAGWDAEPAVEAIESSLRVPVIWGPAAELRAVLDVLGSAV